MHTVSSSNWGRWGTDDQKGTLNLLTPELITKAVGIVKKGKVYSLATPLASDGPITIARNKTWHFLNKIVNDPSPD